MPASRAISSVEAPCSPCRAKTPAAASRISSRRTSFDFRSATTMAGKLVMSHKLVKRLRHTIEVALGEARVERQRERTLEDPGGAREIALVAVGTQAMERVRPDLRLDALR